MGLSVFAWLGAIADSRIAGLVDQQKLKKVFGLFLIIMGIYILVRTLPSVWPF